VESFSHASQARGLVAADAEFVLPLQVARRFDHAAVGAEVARHFVANQADTWQLGGFVEYDCGPTLECLAEINTHWDNGAQTIVNFGGRRELTKHINFLGSFGRQINGRRDERTQWLFYLGAQFVTAQ
jgi:hypothetical protein